MHKDDAYDIEQRLTGVVPDVRLYNVKPAYFVYLDVSVRGQS